MKFFCKNDMRRKDLHYESSASNEIIFKKGEWYELVPRVIARYENMCNYIEIYAMGEDGKPHLILEDELHYDVVSFALGNFNFLSAHELAEKFKDK